MRRTVAARLRSRAGESISEVLVALLVSALALMMLASMVASSSNMVQTSRQKMQDYITAENALTEQSGKGTDGTVTVQNGGEGLSLYDGADSEIAVTYYQNTTVGGKTVTAYKVK